MLRATLEIADSVHVEGVERGWEVRLIRAGDWRGSPYRSDYVFMLLLSRLWRWLRHEHRWFVVVAPAGAGNRDGEVRAVAESRLEAIDRGVAVAMELASGEPPRNDHLLQ